MSHAQPAAAADPTNGSTELSGLQLHITLPTGAYAPLYDRAYEGYGTDRLGPEQWIPLGGGSGFLKYRAARQRTELALEANRLLSQGTVAYSAEYAKQANGAIAKLADCGSKSTGGEAGLLAIHLSSSFSYQPDYSLAPNSRVTSVKALRPCLLGSERVDAAPLMTRIYQNRIEATLPVLDRSIRQAASFKSDITKAWKTLQAPIPLDEEKTLWLVLSPKRALAPAEPSWTNGTLSAELAVAATARVVRGTQPAVALQGLPPLEPGRGPEGFHVPFTIDVPYDEANGRLREALVGQDFGIGPGRLSIRRVRVYPVGKQAAVDMDVDGLFALRIKLRGLPAYDQTTETIGLKQIEFEVQEKNALMNFADELLHDAIRDQLAGLLKVPIRESLEAMRAEIQAALNRDIEGGKLHGQVDRLRLMGLAVGSQTLSASFHTDGALRYEVR